MAHVEARIGTSDYAVTLTSREHRWTSDEPPALGGRDAGPAPFELLLGGLGSCTAITLRMYAKRKQWPLQGVRVSLHLQKGDDGVRIDRLLTFEGDLTTEQQGRLLEIAEKTPVTLVIKSGAAIHTHVGPAVET